MLKFKNNFFKINTCGKKVALWTPTLVGGNGKFFVGGGVHQSPQLGATHPGKGRKKIEVITAPPSHTFISHYFATIMSSL